MTLAALAPSRASTVRIRPTETARCRLDAITHRRNPRPHRGGGHLRGWRTIPLASVRADAAPRRIRQCRQTNKEKSFAASVGRESAPSRYR